MEFLRESFCAWNPRANQLVDSLFSEMLLKEMAKGQPIALRRQPIVFDAQGRGLGCRRIGCEYDCR